MNLSGGLSLDTSVLINLLATEQPWEILSALDCPCFAPEAVVRELKRNPVTQQTYPEHQHPVRKNSNIEIVELHEAELDLFLSLVGAEAPDALGDGEAAAIAVASVRRCAVALDDTKARRIVRERFPSTQVLMTVDILRSPEVAGRLGSQSAKIAFEKAVQFGRMHVPRSSRQAP